MSASGGGEGTDKAVAIGSGKVTGTLRFDAGDGTGEGRG